MSARRQKLDDIGLVTPETPTMDPRPTPEPEKRATRTAKKEKPATGEGRAHYPRVTLTLPPEIIRELHALSGERKAMGERDSGLNAIVVEALLGYFHAKGRPMSKEVMRKKGRG